MEQNSATSELRVNAARISGVNDWFRGKAATVVGLATAYAFGSSVIGGFHYERSDIDVRFALERLAHLSPSRLTRSGAHLPALVSHAKSEAIPGEFARGSAAKISAARVVEIDGGIRSIVADVDDFPNRRRHADVPDRALATVLFTDIVDSTRHAVRLGDRNWGELLERHDEIARAAIAHFRGRVVKSTGDGFLATFDGPTRAVRCATALAECMPKLGIGIRCGLHTGECEIRRDDIGGIAVHIGARIADLAQTGEVLVSSTVKDLANGSGIAFQERGTHVLKGLPGQWNLFTPARHSDSAAALVAAA